MTLPYVIPPAGISASNFFSPTPFVDPSRPPGILADDVDPKTGEIVSLFTGLDPTDGAIIYQWRNARPIFAAIDKNDDSAADAIRFAAQRIMQPFVDAKLVDRVQIVVQAGPDAGDQGDLFCQYRNLRTSQLGKVPVG